MKMSDKELDDFLKEHGARYSGLSQLKGRGGWQVIVHAADGGKTICYAQTRPELIRHMVAAVKGELPGTGTDLLSANRVARMGLTYELGKLLPREEEDL